MHRVAQVLGVLAAAFLLTAATAASEPTLLLVTTTAGCDCTPNRCTVGRQEVDKFLGAVVTKIGLDVIDVSKRPDARRLIGRWSFPPHSSGAHGRPDRPV